MQSVTELAHAKVNLSLHVQGRRLDGYHELSSIVAFADIADVVTITASGENAMLISGPFAGEVPQGENNIIWKAYHWLAARMALPTVQVTLVKNLPVASGIGGGSADAAAMLRGLLRLLGRTLSEPEIVSLAIELGADVPVCFRGRDCCMEGMGDKISALTIELPPALVLVNSLQPCSTSAVFAKMGLRAGQKFDGGHNLWRNDMTEAALRVQPAIAHVLTALEQTKLKPCLMSGSGATCFGLALSFDEAEIEAKNLKSLHPKWWVKAARILT